MASPTTSAERAPRIAAIAYEANRGALQALLEYAAEAIADVPPETPLTREAHALAARIGEALEPEVPEFERGERVGLPSGFIGLPGDHIGRVVDRYLNERGEWEYEVRRERRGNPATETHPEKDLRFIEGVSGSVA
jgi:hypothetical protein